MLLPTRPARPSLGKEANALFFWLVLRTAPYELIMSILTWIVALTIQSLLCLMPKNEIFPVNVCLDRRIAEENAPKSDRFQRLMICKSIVYKWLIS